MLGYEDEDHVAVAFISFGQGVVSGLLKLYNKLIDSLVSLLTASCQTAANKALEVTFHIFHPSISRTGHNAGCFNSRVGKKQVREVGVSVFMQVTQAIYNGN